MPGPDDAEIIEWDDDADETGNTGHLRRHGIGQDEAEEVFHNEGALVRNKRSASGDWKLVGLTNAGRALTLVLSYDERRRTIRVFTGWDSTLAERTRYLDGRRRGRR